MSEAPRLLIAGGGTGGHLFPGLAVADAWQQAGGETLFVGTPHGLEARLLPAQGRALALLQVGKLKGGGIKGRLFTLLGLPLALWQAWQIVRTFRPQVVLGVGGYASAPAVVAAWLAGIPVALHEQNALPGMTNRWLGRLAQKIFISFPQAAAWFGHKHSFTGNPVRQALLQPKGEKTGEQPFHLLVFGGSLGASVFSQVVPPAVKQLHTEGVVLKITQQARQEDLAALAEFYRQAGVDGEVTSFIEDMATAYHASDLVICRAGATSIAELAALGKAALLVPYPHAADDHQTANGQAWAATGGGWMVPQQAFTVPWLVDFLRHWATNRDSLPQEGAKAKQLANPNAAQVMAEQLRLMAAKD
ncbi:MAG: undecaprenyldiphospho-muramoylpentapeptide beta-N-acetylglucosaminyltransferase [Magnetococcales bacterium]|nr:undecaprenyldiphospho-muramoylpentapeptide beta-N-acetylglucosaminyltransferase [Magnetococcales bacterium]NGZ29109.1 undecaprenyldiphospho-muramoylpentapeptide beta-N-acetylglucosaminyltransferase [Magnetococcales bacterium]